MMLALLCSIAAGAQNKNKKNAEEPIPDEWNDKEVFEQNKLYPRANVVPYANENAIEKNAYTQSPHYVSLNGKWRCNVVASVNRRDNPEAKDFGTEGWDEVSVPSSVLEVRGKNHKAPELKNANMIPSDNPVATYWREFEAPKSWNGYAAYLKVQAKSAYYIWINQQYVGYSEDSRTYSEFNISKHIKYGKTNTIAIQVMGASDGSLLEMEQDRSLIGITGDVSIMLKPMVNVQDMEIAATYNNKFGNLKLNLNIENANKKGHVYVETVIWDTKGKEVEKTGKWVVFDKKSELTTTIGLELGGVKPWTAETPNLYTVVVRLRDDKMQLVETVGARFGFRTVEVKGGLLLVNQKPITLRGANYTGYDVKHNGLVSEEQMRNDLRLMKQNNINAIHTSVYSPADPRFYELCDEYGFYVICDANISPYSNASKAVSTDKNFSDLFQVRVQNMYETLKNHPSIIVWSLGNGVDNGICMENAYRVLKQKDKSRPVLYAGAEYSENTDIIASRNLDIDDLKVFAAKSQTRPLVLLSYGSSQGNNFGGMEPMWQMIRSRSSLQGGFINTWNSSRCNNPINNASVVSSGVITQYGEASPFLDEIRNIYRPFNVELVALTADHGEFTVTNFLDYLSLNDFVLEYNIFSNLKPRIIEGEVNVDLNPGESKNFKLKIPKLTLYSGEELFIRFTIRQRNASLAVPKSAELGTIEFPIPMREVKKSELPTYDQEELFVQKENDNQNNLHIFNNNMDLRFDYEKAEISSYIINDKEILADRPSLNFYRAPTDNDRNDLNGSKLWNHLNNQQIQRSVMACNYRVIDKYKVGIDAMIRYTDASGNILFDVKQSYLILHTGDVLIDNQVLVTEHVRVMPKVGYQFKINREFDSVQWLGLDKETYSDRQHAGVMGTHTAAAKDLFFHYDRPQEAGNHSKVHWLAVNDAHSGLFIDMLDTNFNFSIYPYSDNQLADASDFSNIKERGYWTLNIDYRQSGVGSSLAGLDIDDKHLITNRDLTFRIHLHAYNKIDNEPQDFRRVQYPVVQSSVLPMPLIAKSAERFDRPMTITLSSTVPGCEIHYTVDGSTPDEKSPLYKKPFTIQTSTIVQAKAFKKGNTPSFTATSRFNFDYIGSVKYENTPNTPYNYNAESILFDGEHGEITDLQTGWLGFSGTDFNAVFTLGKNIDLQDVILHFAHVPDAWAFAPTSVAIYTSEDGETFSGPIYAKIKYDATSVEMKNPQLIAIRVNIERSNVRYVKIVAKNMGKIPAWHKYKGLRPWVMIDEIELNEVIK